MSNLNPGVRCRVRFRRRLICPATPSPVHSPRMTCGNCLIEGFLPAQIYDKRHNVQVPGDS